MNDWDLVETLLDLCEKLYFPLRLRIKEATRYQYRIAIRDYARFLEREPTKGDLQDDLVTLWMRKRMDDGLAIITARERAGRIGTLWTWLAKRRLVDSFPTFEKPLVPESLPIALSEDELNRFFHSAAKERGTIAGIPADLWCLSYFAFVFNSSERKTAALSVRVAWMDLEQAVCSIPPQFRKGGTKWGVYPLWPEAVSILRDCIAVDPSREHVWPWDKCKESYYTMYNRINRDAGLPTSRKYKTHSLRVSHNTWTKVMTGDHSPLLRHSSRSTSERSYEDKRFTQKDSQKLFTPWQKPIDRTPPPGT